MKYKVFTNSFKGISKMSKKIILFSAVSAIATTCFADDEKKNTLEIHAKGSANSTFLFNSNISDAGGDQDYAAGWSFNYGAGVSMYFGKVAGGDQDYAAGWSFNYGAGVSMYFGKVGFAVEGLMGNHRAA